MNDELVKAVDNETSNITHDFLEWVELMNQRQVEFFSNEKATLLFVFDSHIASTLLKDNFDGFMTKPTARFEGKPVEAKSRVVKSIDDLVDIKSFLDKEPGKKFLYNFNYYYPRWITHQMDTNTFEVTNLDKPARTDEGWIIRYGSAE